MRLFIAEKPDLAKVIAEGLGNGRRKGGYIECGSDIVTWCIGHLLQLAPPEHHNPKYADWVAADLPLKLRPATYIPIEKTQDQLAIVCGLIEQATEIIHAGDPDEEGQLLDDEVLEYVGNTRPPGQAVNAKAWPCPERKPNRSRSTPNRRCSRICVRCPNTSRIRASRSCY